MYEGPIDKFWRDVDVPYDPIRNHVNVYYAVERFGVEEPKEPVLREMGEQSVDLQVGFVGVRPVEVLEFRVDSLGPARDLPGLLLADYVAVYHSGCSDEVEAAIPSKAAIPEESPAYSDYPRSRLYMGPHCLTEYNPDIMQEDLRKWVQVYHSGRSDEPSKKAQKEPSALVPEPPLPSDMKQSVGARLSDLVFGRDVELEYPLSDVYEGPIDITCRVSDIEETPLQKYGDVEGGALRGAAVPDASLTVSVDSFKAVGEVEDMSRTVVAYMRPPKDQPSIGHIPELPSSRLIFKKDGRYIDYAKTGVYAGKTDSTARSEELEAEPIKEHVNIYHSGRSDEPVAASIKPADESLKKRGAVIDYPTAELYRGPLFTVHRTDELEKAPIQHYVNVYGSGLVEGVLPAPISVKKKEPEKLPETMLRSKTAVDVVTSRFEKPAKPTSYEIRGSRMTASTESDTKPSGISSFESAALSAQRERPPEVPKRDLTEKGAPRVPVRQFYTYDVKETRILKPRPPPPPRPCREIVEAAALARQKRLEKERRQIDLDVSISAKGPVSRPTPTPPTATVPVERERIIREPVVARAVTAVSAAETPENLSDYYFKTREVDYWIGRHSERQSRPLRDLTADIGIDVASDEHWEEKQLGGARRATSLQPESIYARSTRRDVPPRGAQMSARSVSPTAHLHWTTVSETTSVSYSKKVSIERRRPRPRQPVEIPSVHRQYRPPPPPPEVAVYGRSGWTTFDSDMPRPYSGVAVQGETREARYSTYAQYGGPSSFRTQASQQPSAYYATSETKASAFWYDVT
ncbi:hypothetical protein Tcan_05825 [Toxocara canis]|uniref:Uncharacterized protein n=1 Tax=Toxocara canis TaxID=6265 RepID=A0A0B2UUP9_TOXCA|nr:hypothetical protein Tcan_05825 [Toxocara canis]